MLQTDATQQNDNDHNNVALDPAQQIRTLLCQIKQTSREVCLIHYSYILAILTSHSALRQHFMQPSRWIFSCAADVNIVFGHKAIVLIHSDQTDLWSYILRNVSRQMVQKLPWILRVHEGFHQRRVSGMPGSWRLQIQGGNEPLRNYTPCSPLGGGLGWFREELE